MDNLDGIIKMQLSNYKDEKVTENYMFFSNLKQLHRQCQMLLELDPSVVESIIQNGHDWADDHIAVAKENVDQVFDFMMNTTKESINEAKSNKLCARGVSAAKSKFKVYPSAYANGFASKWYKKRGGGWRTVKKKSSNESIETNEASSPAQQAAIAINMKKKGIKPKNENVNEDLRNWFKEKWVDVSKKVDGKHPPCGRKDADGKAYPKCRPSKKVSSETPKVASSYDKDEKKAMTQQKRREEKKDPKVGTGNKPTMTHYKKK